MKINRNKKRGWNYLDENGIILCRKANKGKGDSLGRNSIALDVYQELEDYEQLISGIKSFFLPDGYVLRYPGEPDDNFHKSQSRDHIVKALSILKNHGEHRFVKWYLEHRTKPVTKDFKFTIPQLIWLKALYSKPWSTVFTIVNTFELLGVRLWNKAIRGIRPVVQNYKSLDEYNKYRKIPMTEQQKRRKKWVIPEFSLFYNIYMVKALPVKRHRKWLKYILGSMFERSNYAARLLCDKGLSPSEWVDAKEYKATHAFRWSIRLDDLCDRDMKTYKDAEGSNLEADLLKTLLWQVK